MTTKQKIELRLSEVREKLNDLSGLEGDALTDEKRTELDGLLAEYKDLEKRHRAAIVAEDETRSALDKEDREAAELRSLVGRASLAAYVSEVVNATPLAVGSAEAELRKSLLGDDAQPGQIPWAVLAPEVVTDRKEDRKETRADAPTSLGAITLPSMQSQILGRVFAQSAMAFVGIQMPSVPVGRASWPILTDGPSGSQAAKGGTVDAVAATFAADAITPTRVTARVLFSVEDLSQLRGMEDALRSDLNMALSDAMDLQALTGNGTAPNVTGLLQILTNPTDPSDTFTWSDPVRELASGVDGKFAATSDQVRLLVPPGLYAPLAVLLHATAPVGSAARYIEEISGGLRVSANLPAPTSGHIARALLIKTGQTSAVAPVWEGVTLVRDPYTGAASGQVALTAVALWGFRVLRTDAFAIKKFKIQ